MARVGRRRTLLLLGLIIVLGTVYLLFNTRGFTRHGEIPGRSNYNLLGEALAAGHLYLNYDLSEERARNAEPNDPRLSSGYLMDAVIFDGKYFFLQEPLPGLLHASWFLITKRELPTGLVVILAACGCLLVLTRLLELMRSEFFPDSPGWLSWYISICFGLSSAQLYLVSKPTVYHEAIGLGVLFVLIGVLFYAKALIFVGHREINLWLCGLMFGLAALSRLTLILYVPTFIVAFFVFLTSRNWKLNTLRYVFAMTFLPAVAISVILVYNYARFGDAFDFGRRHIMYPWAAAYEYVCVQGNAFRLSHVPYNISAYFFTMPEVLWRNCVPWLRFTRDMLSTNGVLVGREQLGSIVLLMPCLVLLVPVQRLFGTRDRSRPLKTMVLAAWISSLTMLGMFMCYFYAVARYLYEFTPLLFLVMFCNVAETATRIDPESKIRSILILGLVLLVLANSLMGVYLGLNGMVQLS